MKYLPEGAGEWQRCPGYNKKVLLTGEDLADRGALVQLIEIPPRTAVAAHYHEHCTEVFHLVRGTGTFAIADRTVEAGPGDTLTCQPHEVHSVRNDGDAPLHYVVFKTNATTGDIHWV
jgi:mannose-6-phosphate isomerase-like protein (cupin superfamily)